MALPAASEGWLDGFDGVGTSRISLDAPGGLGVAVRARRVVTGADALPPVPHAPAGAALCAPLELGARGVGGAAVWWATPRAVAPGEALLLEAMLAHIAAVLARVQLEARSRHELERHRFLAHASETLSGSLDPTQTLQHLAELAVPAFADWMVADLFEPDDTVRRVAVHHVDPAKVALAHEAFRRYGPSPAEVAALRQSPPVLISEHSDAILVATCKDEEHLRISRGLGFRSVVLVPLRARGEVRGAITFVTTSESGRTFDPTDLELAVDLVRRAGVALESSLLYREVEEARERYRLATEAVRGLVYEVELATGRVLHSSGLEEVVGFAPSDERATEAWWWSRVHPEDLAGAQLRMVEARASGAVRLEAVYRVLHRGGDWRWVSDSSRLVRDAAGQVVRMVGCTIDVTERVLARAALEESDRRKDEFLAVLGHELRNPLAAIRTATDVVAAPAAAPEAVARARDVLVRQVRHMSRMLDDLLDLSRITSGKLAVHDERVDLVAVARETVDDLAAAAAAAGVTVDLRAPGRTVALLGDGTRLAQIIGNLLHNAIKYSPRGGRIGIDLDLVGTEVVLVVADEGRGIPAELLDKVFEPFVQGEHGSDGLGLGLALVRGLVTLHGGTVEATSEGIGRGARLVVRLPVREPPPAVPEAASGAGPGRRILLVEDNPDTAQMLQLLLELAGHDVAVASDGPTALTIADRCRPEVVLCDIGLPGMDGYAVARALRGGIGRSAFLVALTGFGQAEDQRRALEAGFDRHFTKPVDPETLERLVATAGR